jgi:hypothetical protein
MEAEDEEHLFEEVFGDEEEFEQDGLPDEMPEEPAHPMRPVPKAGGGKGKFGKAFGKDGLPDEMPEELAYPVRSAPKAADGKGKFGKAFGKGAPGIGPGTFARGPAPAAPLFSPKAGTHRPVPKAGKHGGHRPPRGPPQAGGEVMFF